MNNPIQTAVLLAAGRGKRLRPHTDTIPKPLLPVNGRPTLDYVLTAVANAGIQHVCLITHYLQEQIHDYVGDGSQWGLSSSFCTQLEMKGTAHALQTAVHAHPHLFPQTAHFLLTATDYIFTPNFLADLCQAHQQAQTDMVVSLKEVPTAELSSRSSVEIDKNGRIHQIIEKPKLGQAPSNLSANLTFVLPTAVTHYLPHMQPSPRGEYELQTILNQMLDDGYTAHGLLQPIPPEWTSSPKF